MLELSLHSMNLLFHLGVLILNVCYETDSKVLEDALLLEFKPLLLEYIHSLRHLRLGEEVSDEVIDDHGALEHLGCKGLFLSLEFNGVALVL